MTVSNMPVEMFRALAHTEAQHDYHFDIWRDQLERPDVMIKID
jgi:hypothetical protein